MKWRKCRNPKKRTCDKCMVCGGCKVCPEIIMYHRGDDSLCEACYKGTSIRDQLVEALKTHRQLIVEADEWRPLADHILELAEQGFFPEKE